MLRQGKSVNVFVLNAYWFGLSFMWNAIHPLILPLLLLNLSARAKNTLYGMLTFLGLLIALVMQPISGALSDYTRSALGRRRPWMLIGTLLNILWLFALVGARTYWGIAISYMGLQFCSNLAQGPAQGLIPDLIPREQRGTAAGIKSLFEMLGVVVAALAISRLVDTSAPNLFIAVSIVCCMLLIAFATTFFGISEEPTGHHLRRVSQSLWQQIKAIFSIQIREHADYARLLLSRFCVLLGTNTVAAFALYYFSDVLGVQAPARTVGNLMTVIGLSVLVSAYPAGILSERWGRRRLSLFACGAVAFGMALLALMRRPDSIWGLGALIGLGMGVFSTVNWAWATDLVPEDEAGKYLGLSNLATAGAAAASRLFGPLIDLINVWVPNGGYSVLFIVATLGALAGLFITLSIPEPRDEPQKASVHVQDVV